MIQQLLSLMKVIFQIGGFKVLRKRSGILINTILTFNVRIMAICPIWYRQDYDLGLQKSPLFWVPFDLLRPYLAQNEILVSDRNNGARETMDDLFIKTKVW